MIYEARNKLLAKQAADKIEDLRIEDVSTAFATIIDEWDSPARILLFEEIKDKVTGVFFAVMSEYRKRNVMFIIYAGADKDRKNTIFEFLARAKKRAKENSLETMLFLTRRNPKAFARKYKFHPIETLLEYNISKEEK